MMDQVNNADTADSTYKSLYKLGGAAALIVAVLTLSEVIGLAFYPQPGTVRGCDDRRGEINVLGGRAGTAGHYKPTRRWWFQHGPLPGVRCGPDSLIGHVPEQILQQVNRLCGNSGICTVIGRLSQTSSDDIGNCRAPRDSSECPVPGDMVCLGRLEALPAKASRRKDASQTTRR